MNLNRQAIYKPRTSYPHLIKRKTIRKIIHQFSQPTSWSKAEKLSVWVIGLFLCWITVLPVYGQLRGQVHDTEQRPIAFANVLLLNPADSALVQGAITNNNGQFTLPVPSAEAYLLAISMVGYQPLYTQVQVLPQKALELGTYILRENTQPLTEVVVRGRKPLYEQQADRLVVQVQNSITSAGSTALEILERSPGVVINPQSGAISLNGKEGVSILINGKLTNMPAAAVLDRLRGINGSTIANIELMTNPSARYDAEGAGGTINIVLQPNTNYGSNGSVSVTSGYGYGEKVGSSFTLNHRCEKFSIYTDYSFLRNRTQQTFDFYRTFKEPGNPAFTSTVSDRRPVTINQSFRAGFDYPLRREATTLSGLVTGYSNNWQMLAFNRTLLQSNTQNTFIQGENTETNYWRHLMGNLSLTHVFRPGQELRWDMDYLTYQNTNPSDYTHDFTDETGNVLFNRLAYIRKKTPIRMGVTKVDYQYALCPNITWEMGLKGTTSRFTNDVLYRYQQGNEWLTQKHNLREDLAAAYTSWNVQVNAATKINAGLRWEYTRTQLSSAEKRILHRQYGNFFPSLLVAHQFSEHRAVQLTYSRRITRPTFNALAPFVIFYGPNNFVSGNPALQPSIVQAVKVQYQWRNLLASVQYSHESNPIAGFQPHVNTTTYEMFNYAENLKQAQSSTFGLTLPWQVTPWWKMENSMLGICYSLLADYLETPEQLTNYNFRLNSTQSILLPKGFSGELSGYYQSPFLYGVYRQKATGVVNVGLQKKLNHQAGTLSLTWEDVFWTTTTRWVYDRAQQNLNSHLSYALGEPRVVKLTYSRSFGDTKVKAASKRTSGSEEEQKRVN